MRKRKSLLPLALCALVFLSGCALTGEDESVRKTFSTDEALSAVVVRDDNGDSNLGNRTAGGGKSLDLSTANGDIDIQFVS